MVVYIRRQIIKLIKNQHIIPVRSTFSYPINYGIYTGKFLEEFDDRKVYQYLIYVDRINTNFSIVISLANDTNFSKLQTFSKLAVDEFKIRRFSFINYLKYSKTYQILIPISHQEAAKKFISDISTDFPQLQKELLSKINHPRFKG